MASASLAWLRSHGSDITFRCRRCGWMPRMDIDVAIDRFGPGATLEAISGRLVCRNPRAPWPAGGICGARDAVAEAVVRSDVRRGMGDLPSELDARLAELAERDRLRLGSLG